VKENNQCVILNKRCLIKIDEEDVSKYADALRKKDMEVTGESMCTLEAADLGE